VVGKRLVWQITRIRFFASFVITGVAKNPPPIRPFNFDIIIPFSYLQICLMITLANAYLSTFVIIHPHADLKQLQQKFITIHNAYAEEQMEQGKKPGSFVKQTFYTLNL